MLPAGRGILVVRTNFTDQWAWDDLCELARRQVRDGRIEDVRLVDEPDYEGVAAEDLLNLVPEGAAYSHLAVADELTRDTTSGSRAHSLLLLSLHRQGETCRMSAAAFASAGVSPSLEDGQGTPPLGRLLSFHRRPPTGLTNDDRLD